MSGRGRGRGRGYGDGETIINVNKMVVAGKTMI